MNSTGEPETPIGAVRDTMIRQAQGLGLTEVAAELSAQPDFPGTTAAAPLIIDTDIGGDPDDAVAVAIAAALPQLKLVITADECRGRRARFARHLLDLLGRTDVAVAAGQDLGETRYWAAEGLTPEHISTQPANVPAAVRAVLDASPGVVRWVGMGPLSNLAHVLDAIPGAAQRLEVTQMGGGLTYRRPDTAEHNIRLDLPAARKVLGAGLIPWLMPSNLTFHPDNEITAQSAEYQLLAAAPGAWNIVRAHMDQWFTNFYPGTMQHDALALALALGLPFIDTTLTGVGLDEIGRMQQGEHHVQLAFDVDYGEFRAWLTHQIQSSITGAQGQS